MPSTSQTSSRASTGLEVQLRQRLRDEDARDAQNPKDNIRASMFKLVDTFGRLTKKPLKLVNGESPRTDTQEYIEVPFDHQSAYLLTEHEISHVLFKSDPVAKQIFVEEYTEKTVQQAKANQIEVDPEYLEKAVTKIIDILEDQRVNSLWGLLYPGSYHRMFQYGHDLIADRLGYANTNFPTFFFTVAYGIDVEAPAFEPYRPVLAEALRKVELRGFGATLAMSKWLVTQLVDLFIQQALGEKAAQEAGPPVRSEALEQLVHKFKLTPSNLEEHLGDTRPAKAVAPDQLEASQDLARTVLTTPKSKLIDFAEKTGPEMRDLVKEVRAFIAQARSADDQLRKDITARVVFRDIKRIEKAELDPEDRDIISRLRSIFLRVMGRRELYLTDAGSEIDIQAVIERRIRREALPCFRSFRSGRGFKALLLVDRSGSMNGDKILQVERACRILTEALRFPFVNLTVWGFQSEQNGQVDITRYDPRTHAYTSKDAPVRGGTPLHAATEIALRHLESKTDSRHLYILSDGLPIYATRKDQLVPTAQLSQTTRAIIRRGRARGAQISGILVGTDLGDKTLYDLTPKQMAFIFGPSRFWKRIEPDHLGRDLIQLVTSSFVRYLRE